MYPLPISPVVLGVAALACFAWEASAEPRRSALGIAAAGQYGLLDAAFGKALLKARQVAQDGAETAFVLDTISGMRDLDAGQELLAVRLQLVSGLPRSTEDEHKFLGRGAGLEDALDAAEPTEADLAARISVPDLPVQFHIGSIEGLLNSGGLPPQITARARWGPAPGEGAPGIHRSSTADSTPVDWQRDLDLAIDNAVHGTRDGSRRFVYRVVTWTFQRGSAGGTEGGVLIEARQLSQTETGVPLKGSLAEAVDRLRRLVASKDWPALASHYDLSSGGYHEVELQSGAFFHDPIPSKELGPPVLSEYRHPFHPLANLIEVRATDDPMILVAEMQIEIDQGGGSIQKQKSSFRLKRVGDGLLVLPD